jgi:hypothetical protein
MAAAKQHLRPVRRNERAKPLTVEAAAKTGDRRKLLISMRDRVAATISDPACAPRDLAALTRRLQDIVRDIELIDTAADKSLSVVAATLDDDFDAATI